MDEIKPGDLVKTHDQDVSWDLLSRGLDTHDGGMFGVGDVGLVLEVKEDFRSTYCRVLTPRGDGWMVQDLVKKVVDSYHKPGILLHTRYGQCFIWDETQRTTLGHLKRDDIAIGMGYIGKYYIRVLTPGGILGSVLDTEVTIVPKSREP